MVIKSVFLTKNYQILVILGNVDVSDSGYDNLLEFTKPVKEKRG